MWGLVSFICLCQRKIHLTFIVLSIYTSISRKSGRYDNLKREMKTMQLDILVIAETRWTCDGYLKTKNTWWYTQEERNTSMAWCWNHHEEIDSRVYAWLLADIGETDHDENPRCTSQHQYHTCSYIRPPRRRIDKFYDSIKEAMKLKVEKLTSW